MNTTLEDYRMARGMTFRQMAACCGFKSATTVWQHCCGVRRVSPESAVKYQKSLGIPLSELRPDLWPPAAPNIRTASEEKTSDE